MTVVHAKAGDPFERELPCQVARWVKPQYRRLFNLCVLTNNWVSALMKTKDENMLSLCIDLTLTGFIPDATAARLVGEMGIPANGASDGRLNDFLARLRDSGHRAFSGDRSNWDAAFADLPERLTIYRGTTQAERGPCYGIHWTTYRPLAVSFAVRQVAPVLLTAGVNRDDLCGFMPQPLVFAPAAELLVLPADLQDVSRTALIAQDAADTFDVGKWQRTGDLEQLGYRMMGL